MSKKDEIQRNIDEAADIRAKLLQMLETGDVTADAIDLAEQLSVHQREANVKTLREAANKIHATCKDNDTVAATVEFLCHVVAKMLEGKQQPPAEAKP
ncbi:MAG TPA: hypothetical protein VH575_25235 [Gemmataceae bacterium]|jgi:hypothetical protein